jgi:hypothetical protein
MSLINSVDIHENCHSRTAEEKKLNRVEEKKENKNEKKERSSKGTNRKQNEEQIC